MVKENDTKFKRLEKAHHDTQEKVEEMIEMLRILMKGKVLIEGSYPQGETTQPEGMKGEPTYLPGYTPSTPDSPNGPNATRTPSGKLSICLCTFPDTIE